MQVIHDLKEFQALTMQWRKKGLKHAFVPTMGALHEGHYRLVDHARTAGEQQIDKVSVSIFVNPTQFGPNEDLDAYPRTLDSDVEGCAERGADVVFAPSANDMYPDGFQTKVVVEHMTQPLCGKGRPVHFGGVTQVCMKLFQLAQANYGVFGWKDAQQLLVLRRMVRDMCVPIEIIGVDTVREADGLAMSSRNQYLSEAERTAAPVLYRGLCAVRDGFEAGEHNVEKLLQVARNMIEPETVLALEYLEARDMEKLEPLEEVQPYDTLIALAAKCGKARLIDNIRL